MGAEGRARRWEARLLPAAVLPLRTRSAVSWSLGSLQGKTQILGDRNASGRRRELSGGGWSWAAGARTSSRGNRGCAQQTGQDVGTRTWTAERWGPGRGLSGTGRRTGGYREHARLVLWRGLRKAL